MENVKILNHPLIQHKLTLLRDKETSVTNFRNLVNEISNLMVYEIFKDINITNKNIQTPISDYSGKEIVEKINLFPILRAGEGMLYGVLNILPNASVGHIGIYRDEKTFEPKKYLFKYPKYNKGEKLFNLILDPMIATGGSLIKAIETINEAGFIDNVRVVSILSSKKGIEKVTKKFPNVKIYLCAIDDELNKNNYIIPGLGDAGDRIFGTK